LVVEDHSRVVEYNVPIKKSTNEFLSILNKYNVPIEFLPEKMYAINWKYEKFGDPDFEKLFRQSTDQNVIIKKRNTISFYNDVIKKMTS